MKMIDNLVNFLILSGMAACAFLAAWGGRSTDKALTALLAGLGVATSGTAIVTLLGAA